MILGALTKKEGFMVYERYKYYSPMGIHKNILKIFTKLGIDWG